MDYTKLIDMFRYGDDPATKVMTIRDYRIRRAHLDTHLESLVKSIDNILAENKLSWSEAMKKFNRGFRVLPEKLYNGLVKLQSVVKLIDELDTASLNIDYGTPLYECETIDNLEF